MNKHTAKITSKSIEQSGLPIDYRKAIMEYLWNGFDAGASEIEINFDGNETGYLNNFTIKDNGTGINIEDINETFGHFLDSQKRDSFNKDGFVKGKKGKGRYAFSIFSNKCTWSTVFKGPKDEKLAYTITIDKGDLHNFSTSDKVISNNSPTGTIVRFDNFFDLTSDLLEKKDFQLSLANEFGWFLILNKENNYNIIINGDDLDYKDIIGDHEEIHELIGDVSFKITFLRWNNKIGDKYYHYFLNSDKKEISRKFTSFNNKAIDFHHSLYIQSQYFDDFKETQEDAPVLGFASRNQDDVTFKDLLKVLNKLVSLKEKHFIRDLQADKLITEFKSKGIFPLFRNNTYDSYRQKDLESVVKELYCAQPKLFHGLNKEQSKTLVGFLNLLLDTDQREKVLDILDGIVKLTDDERIELSKSLKMTKLSSITSMIKLLQSRFTVVELLKFLVFDLEKFTNERDHIQQVIENNYWLFGEQYHIVSADVNFETVLNNYLHFLEQNPSKKPHKITDKAKLRRPDIFICRQSFVPDGGTEDLIEENIIVELKRPSVLIGKEQFSQVEDYLRVIIDEPRFNSTLRKWKFLLIGKSLDSFITDKHESQKHKGKRFLVEAIKNYEIYALTWDDVFKQFGSRHQHLIDKLDFKLPVIEELQDKGITFERSQSDTITKLAVSRN